MKLQADFIGLLATVIFGSLAAADGPDDNPITAQKKLEDKTTEFYHDFRNKDNLDANFKLVGPEAAKRVKPEPEGLRITLPAKQKNPDAVGVAPKFSIKGDVEITVGYEILQADQPKEGWGVSF